MKLRNLLLTGLLTLAVFTLKAEVKVISLSTDYKTNPIGIDNPIPQLAWIVQSDEDNTMQASYEIRAALNPRDLKKGKNLLWDTDKVVSSQSVHIKYQGQALKSYQKVYWQVRIVDNHGEKSKWSEVAFWEMGILSASDWKASWISPNWEEDSKVSVPSPYLRKEFKE